MVEDGRKLERKGKEKIENEKEKEMKKVVED